MVHRASSSALDLFTTLSTGQPLSTVRGRIDVDMIPIAPGLSKLETWVRSVVQALWWQPLRARSLACLMLAAPLSWLYRAAALGHRLATRAQAPNPLSAAQNRRAGRARVPTIVVGNWVVGGAGKTPTTLALLNHLQRTGWSPGVISRGYGRGSRTAQAVNPRLSVAEEVGDEPLLIAQRGRVPVVVGQDRCAARDLLLSLAPEVDIVLADDGLQHHRLWRDLSIVVVDERGVGNGWCLPAGPLRQSVPRHLPLDTLLLYSAGEASLALPGYCAHRQLSAVQPLSDWAAGRPWPSHGGWDALKGLELHAAAAIAVPERFFAALRHQGLELASTHALPDHDPWHTAPWPHGIREVIVTEKDAVKLAPRAARAGNTRLWVARLDLGLPVDFTQVLDRRLVALSSLHANKA